MLTMCGYFFRTNEEPYNYDCLKMTSVCVCVCVCMYHTGNSIVGCIENVFQI